MNSVILDLAVVKGNIRKQIRILFKEQFCFCSDCIILATVSSLEPQVFPTIPRRSHFLMQGVHRDGF